VKQARKELSESRQDKLAKARKNHGKRPTASKKAKQKLGRNHRNREISRGQSKLDVVGRLLQGVSRVRTGRARKKQAKLAKSKQKLAQAGKTRKSPQSGQKPLLRRDRLGKPRGGPLRQEAAGGATPALYRRQPAAATLGAVHRQPASSSRSPGASIEQVVGEPPRHAADSPRHRAGPPPDRSSEPATGSSGQATRGAASAGGPGFRKAYLEGNLRRPDGKGAKLEGAEIKKDLGLPEWALDIC